MRLILTIVILSIASISIAFGQSNTTTHTSEDRKTDQGATSSNYYINERGLAVYRKNPINATSPKTASPNTDSSRTEVLVKKEVKEDSNASTAATSTNQTAVTNDSNVEKRVSSSFFLKKEPKPVESFSAPKETVVVNQTEEVEVSKKEDKTVVKNIISVLGSGSPNKTGVNQLEEIEEEDVIVEKPKSNKKKSVFDRKRESQYKTLEEAALAVEALLEDLKKDQQAQSNTGGSMSARLSRGANKSLRKNAATTVSSSSNSKSPETSKSVVSKESSKKVENSVEYKIDDEFDNLPSYFINGQQVEKVEVDRLRKKDIIGKEVRVRNTVTGNPNGEIWYEVK